MTDKNQQKPTERGNINPETGLTPQQEQAAMMLATGETITAVAIRARCTHDFLKVDSTLFDEDEYNKALQWYGLQPD